MPLLIIKKFCRVSLKKIKKNPSGSTNHDNSFADFCRDSIKTRKKKMAQFSQFQFRVFPCHPREQFQCLNTVLTNITGPLFLEFTRCAKAIFSRFKKIASSVTNGNFLIFSGKRSRFLPFPASVHLSLFFFLKFLPETLVTYRTIISQ